MRLGLSERGLDVRAERIGIPAAGRTIPAIVVSPRQRGGGAPGVLWLHGGGFATGMKEMVFMSRAIDLVERYGAVVLAPGYRLSLQAPYPAALNDCYASLLYLARHASELGIDPQLIMVGGESAGGGLTAALCMMARDRGQVAIAYQMPLYPMLSNLDTPTSRDNHAKVWNTRRNHMAWRLYLRQDATSPQVSPYAAPSLQTDYHNLPPAYTFVGTAEPFYAETLDYVANLRAAGVEATCHTYEGMYHAFDLYEPNGATTQLVRERFCAAFEHALAHYRAPQPVTPGTDALAYPASASSKGTNQGEQPMSEHAATAAANLPRFETNTWTGSGVGRFNEDYALVSCKGRCAALVDGATGLTKVNLVPGESDAAWYARHLCRALVAGAADASRDVASLYERAGREVADAYRRFDGAAELERIDEPNGSVAVLRWDDESLRASILGDCTVVVGLSDGTCELLYDDTLTKLDNENYERMFAYATERGATMAEARRALNPRFIENRLKMNEPGGYWAADISCRGMGQAAERTFPRTKVSWVFACTDGYANAVDMGVMEGFEELAHAVAAGRGAQVGERLRAAETEDAGCWRVHRSKTSDDATYLIVWLDGSKGQS